jgi:urease accessory protein
MLEFISKADNTITAPFTTLTLPLHLRQKSRQRVTLDNGADAAICLKRGAVLCNNDLLMSREDVLVKVVAAKEHLSVAKCENPLLFARACYHLGNRHMPLQIEYNRLYYLHDHVLDDMLSGLGLTVTQCFAPFEPEAGAYGGSSAHGHGQ